MADIHTDDLYQLQTSIYGQMLADLSLLFPRLLTTSPAPQTLSYKHECMHRNYNGHRLSDHGLSRLVIEVVTSHW